MENSQLEKASAGIKAAYEKFRAAIAELRREQNHLLRRVITRADRAEAERISKNIINKGAA